MAEFIYTMVRARKAVGDKLILDDVTMSFFPGAKIGVVGPNGAGKSTILKIMAGLDTPSNGEARLSPGYSVGILMQEPSSTRSKTVLENVQEGVGEIKAKVDRFNEISMAMAEPDADFDTLLAEMGIAAGGDRRGGCLGPRLPARAGDGCAAHARPATRPVRNLSGGEKRRVALTKLLLQKPDLLLLDEPTNHLDAESVLWLEQHLAKYHGAVLAVTHDRYFLDHVAEWIAEVDRGHLYPYEGNYSTYLREEGRTPRGAGQERREARQAPVERTRVGAQQRQGPPGQVEGASRSLRRDGRPRPRRPASSTSRRSSSRSGPRLGSQVIDAKKLEKGFDGRVLIDDLSFTLPRNGIVGVIGPNGVGKTTLFKTIVGLEPLDGGDLKIGETVDISYVDQGRGGIDPNKTLWEVVSDGQDYIQVGKHRDPVPRLRLTVRLQGPRPAEEGRRALRR